MRFVFRELGYWLLATYAVLDKAYYTKLYKRGYIDKDLKYLEEKYEARRTILRKMKKEGW